MNLYIEPLATQLNLIANKLKAEGAKAYMKNQFDFLGIPTPERRRICKTWIKTMGLLPQGELQKIVSELWKLEEREYQYCAIELMAYHKRQWNIEIISLFEHCITHKSWWDTVDFIATECLGPYFKLFPENIVPITGGWNRSDNIWLQRSSLLFQKAYKKTTDLELLSKYIEHLCGSKEFFIRKAIGWILREYAKTNPQWVISFVGQHELSPLSTREALKHLSN